MNDFPKIGIKTEELHQAVEALICEAYKIRDTSFGAVNWGDIGVVDIEYRLSMLNPGDGPSCWVLIEEASPDCKLPAWLSERIDKAKFPRTYFECAW